MTDIYTRLTIGQTEALLEDVPGFTRHKDDIYFVNLYGNIHTLVLRLESGEIFELYTRFEGNYSVGRSNEWNENRKFSRSYVDNDGNLILQSDYSFEGGSTINHFAKFVARYRYALELFTKEVAL